MMYPYNNQNQGMSPYQYHNGMTTPGLMGGGNPMQSVSGGGWNNPTQNSSNPWNDPGTAGGSGFGSGMGAGIGQLLSALGIGMNGGMDWSNMKNPADAGMGYLNNIGGYADKYFNPYINAGKQAMGQLQGQYGQLINDPASVMNRIGAGFQQSPGFKFESGQAQDAVNRAAAAGGMLGSPMQQQNAANVVNGLASQDYNNYMNRGTGMYNTGLQGLQGINQMGFQGSSQAAQMLKDMAMSQANMAYQGQAGQNAMNMQQDVYNQQRQGSMWDMLGGGAGNIFNSLFGGGQGGQGGGFNLFSLLKFL
jgi:hypothetical protein